ncbi:hypothetical protein HHX47_DHR4000368 [Lentinula edodes]|nr:hypothetical protein HHX47_DHR4000368 [Lentinula edodes]
MQALSLNPILFTQAPALDTAANKLMSFVTSTQWSPNFTQSQTDVKQVLFNTVLPYLKSRSNTPPFAPRAYLLTLLRLLSNTFSSPVLAPQLLLGQVKFSMTALLVSTLLHEDAGVRTAAASLVFNAAAFLQKGRVDAVKNGGGSGKSDIEDEDWEVELVSAVVEAIDREKVNEDVVHRLTACLGCLLRLSPFYQSQMTSLLEVLQAKSILKGKLAKGGCGENGISKKEVKKLLEEIADKLCP